MVPISRKSKSGFRLLEDLPRAPQESDRVGTGGSANSRSQPLRYSDPKPLRGVLSALPLIFAPCHKNDELL